MAQATVVRIEHRPEAVIFDFDGVIADTEPLHCEAFRRVLEPLGIRFTWQEYVNAYMGFDDRDAFREAFRAHGRLLEDRRLPELVGAKSRIFGGIVRDGVNSYPGAVPTIEALHAAGVPLAICSGALRADLEPILSRLGVAHCFLHVVSADDVRKGKPDPEGYLLAYRMLSCSRPSALSSPKRCLAVEDTPAGVVAAKGAGLSVLAVTNSSPAEHLVGADYVARSLAAVHFEGMSR